MDPNLHAQNPRNSSQETGVEEPSPSSDTPQSKFAIIFKNYLTRSSATRLFNPTFYRKVFRNKIIFELILVISDTMEMSHATFYNAVSIFDYVVSQYKLNFKDIVHIAFISLVISCRIHEKPENQLGFEDINKHIYALKTSKMVQLEQHVLILLKFKINIISVFDFMNLFLEEFQGEGYSFFPNNYEAQKNFLKVKKVCVDLLNIGLMRYDFYKFTAQAVAASIIITSRLVFGLSPWTPKMKQFTSISLKSVQDIVYLLYGQYKNDYILNFFRKLEKMNDFSLGIPSNNLNLERTYSNFFEVVLL